MGPIESVASQQQKAYHAASLNAETLAASSRTRSANRGSGSMPTLPVSNFIDSWVAAKMTRDGIKPTVVSSDEEFIRRIYLDLAGRIPSAAETRGWACWAFQWSRRQLIVIDLSQ